VTHFYTQFYCKFSSDSDSKKCESRLIFGEVMRRTINGAILAQAVVPKLHAWVSIYIFLIVYN